jgi:hypothetical protein
MPVSLVCPVCSAAFPVEAGLADPAARAAVVAAIGLWPAAVRPHVLRYFALHAPRARKLQMDKLARLVADFATLISAGTVTRGRDTRPAPLAAWEAGLAQVLQSADAGSLDLPLHGHGLLAEIVYRAAGRAHAADQRATAPLHPSHRPAEIPPPAAPAVAPSVGAGLVRAGLKPAPTETPTADPTDAPRAKSLTPLADVIRRLNGATFSATPGPVPTTPESHHD